MGIATYPILEPGSPTVRLVNQPDGLTCPIARARTMPGTIAPMVRADRTTMEHGTLAMP
jgi:hypothetical protein